MKEVICRNVCFDGKSFVFISKLMTWQFRQNNIKPTPSLYFCQTYIDFVIENLLSIYYTTNLLRCFRFFLTNNGLSKTIKSNGRK